MEIKVLMRANIFALILMFLVLGIWQMACGFFAIPDFILPAPYEIIMTAIIKAPVIFPNALVTGVEIISGIALALVFAIPFAMIMFAKPSIEKAVSPFLVASQAIPVFAIAPLLIVWLGYGIASKVLMAGIIIFFPILVSLLEGFKTCDHELRILFRLMGAGFWKSMRLLYWPWALPNFFAGLKVGVTVATIGAVIGEWVGAQQGLGYLMIQANARLNTNLVFASILWLTAMGLILWSFVGILEKKIINWKVKKEFLP